MRGVRSRPGAQWLPVAVVGLGLLLGAVTLAEVAIRSLDGGQLTSSYAAVVATSLLCDLGLVVGGVWLTHGLVDEARYPHVFGGVLAGVAFASAFLGVVAVSVFDAPMNQFGVLRGAVSLGAAAGFLVGTLNARTVDAAVAAERAVVRAEEAERRQELLEYLNALLRHEVLNTATVIQGNAALVEEFADDADAVEDRIGVVQRQADELNGVIEDVRTLLRATEERVDLERVDLGEVVREELSKLHDRHDSVETEAELPQRLYVSADELVRRLLANLLQNAVEHNDSQTPRVSVSATKSNATVRVQVRDNGPGFPHRDLEDLFEPLGDMNANHGLGLAIVDRLAERYGGSVELTETGPEGSVVTVELPLATAGESGGADRGAATPTTGS